MIYTLASEPKPDLIPIEDNKKVLNLKNSQAGNPCPLAADSWVSGRVRPGVPPSSAMPIMTIL